MDDKPPSPYTMDRYWSSWTSDPDVRAVLLPLSDSARYSAQLPENSVHMEPLRQRKIGTPPPSPLQCTNISEADHGENLRLLVNNAILSSKYALVLRQDKAVNRFSFGSAVSNFFVLKHDPASEDGGCYINLSHCQLYPDPDSSVVWLKNSSTSKQTVQHWAVSSNVHQLSFEQCLTLQSGTWLLNLGERLLFILHVAFPEPPVINKAVSSLSTASPRPSNQPRAVRKPEPRLRQQPSRPNGNEVKNEAKRRRDMVRREHPRTADQLGSSVWSPPETASNLPPAEVQVLGQTYHSRVEMDEREGRKVAIKYCRRPEVPTAWTMWRNEIQALQTIKKHPNVVEVIDIDASNYTITMELLPGLSLEKYIDQHSFSTLITDQCEDIWLGSARGLEWIHDKLLLHNDIKPENVIYDPDSRRTVLIDFGLAAIYNGESFIGGGTPSYVAPEFARRCRDETSDIWALGVVMMFTLKLIQLPRQTWHLNRVHDSASTARRQMYDWTDRLLAIVHTARPRHLELLLGMVCSPPKDRIKAKELATRLVTLQDESLELLA